MTLLTATLRHDPGLAAENTWRLTPGLDEVEARIRMASAPEVVLRVELRYRRSKAQCPLGVVVHPNDAGLEVWTTESAMLHPELPRLALSLIGTPAYVGEAMAQW